MNWQTRVLLGWRLRTMNWRPLTRADFSGILIALAVIGAVGFAYLKLSGAITQAKQ